MLAEEFETLMRDAGALLANARADHERLTACPESDNCQHTAWLGMMRLSLVQIAMLTPIIGRIDAALCPPDDDGRCPRCADVEKVS